MTPRVWAGAAVSAVVLLAGCSSGSGGGPSASPSASASGTASPSASASPTSGGTTWPLTGLPAPGGVTARPAVGFKVDNVYGALPQAGVNQADLVFEEPVEGGLTRLVAVFQSQSPAKVMPIRSARPVDAQILRLFGPSVLVFSGASSHELAPVKALSHAVLLSMDDGAPIFRRDPSRPWVHSVYSSPAKAWAYALSHGAVAKAPNPPWVFTPAPNPLAAPANGVTMQFGAARATWAYQASSKHYVRWQNGSQDVDTAGVQFWADSVLILNVPTYIVPGLKDVLGNPTPDARITGTGTMWLMRDGTMIKGTWSRATLDDPLTFTASDGSSIGVKPGRTWIELLPKPLQPTFS